MTEFGEPNWRDKEPPSSEHIAEIRKRCEAATPGPWWTCGGVCVASKGHEGLSLEDVNGDTQEEDFDFIAHSREDIPWLLSQLEEMTKERDIWRHQCECNNKKRQDRETERDQARAEAERLWDRCNLQAWALAPLPWKSGEES